MKRNWTCSRCLLVFSRKWNLERHVKLMHGFNEHQKNAHSVLGQRESNNYLSDVNMSSPPLFGLKDNYKEVFDFADLQNKMFNSRQTSDRLNSLQWQVNSLQQQLGACDKSYKDLLWYHWVLPKAAFQGISGYICKKCQTFNLKAILDLGCDMTAESKHDCVAPADKRSYVVFPIPPNIQYVDFWAAKILLDYVNFHLPIGKYLIAKEITKGLNEFSRISNPEIAREILGISDKYYLYSLENNYKINWVDRAIGNLDKKLAMLDNEVLDFFSKVHVCSL